MLWVGAPGSRAPPVCAAESRSHFKRVSLRQFAFFPNAGALQRLNRACFIDVNDSIELLRQTCVKIMAQPLSLRPVNHTNSALDPTLLRDSDLASASQIDQESW